MIAAFLFNSRILHIETTCFVYGGCSANEEVLFPDNAEAATLNCNIELPLVQRSQKSFFFLIVVVVSAESLHPLASRIAISVWEKQRVNMM